MSAPTVGLALQEYGETEDDGLPVEARCVALQNFTLLDNRQLLHPAQACTFGSGTRHARIVCRLSGALAECVWGPCALVVVASRRCLLPFSLSR